MHLRPAPSAARMRRGEEEEQGSRCRTSVLTPLLSGRREGGGRPAPDSAARPAPDQGGRKGARTSQFLLRTACARKGGRREGKRSRLPTFVVHAAREKEEEEARSFVIRLLRFCTNLRQEKEEEGGKKPYSRAEGERKREDRILNILIICGRSRWKRKGR